MRYSSRHTTGCLADGDGSRQKGGAAAMWVAFEGYSTEPLSAGKITPRRRVTTPVYSMLRTGQGEGVDWRKRKHPETAAPTIAPAVSNRSRVRAICYGAAPAFLRPRPAPRRLLSGTPDATRRRPVRFATNVTSRSRARGVPVTLYKSSPRPPLLPLAIIPYCTPVSTVARHCTPPTHACADRFPSPAPPLPRPPFPAPPSPPAAAAFAASARITGPPRRG
ncbi:unnamed protein product [Chondrus crispus]|uniref:Uncharacterized protein n=1 Tax=Chondrus crispus TaxID=2769 RepID=R7QAD1_CHOCR|nr:unnamed protein product [Chondrus crispus]CDF34984.1 unnamed protein product [Chondrus crispus]|eukprot:XP_005714803.1 unnamed protein product [Chondrus crispus]